MRVLCIDDEQMTLELLKLKLEKIDEVDEIFAYTNPLEALKFLEENSVDVVFQDINMPQMNGITAARKIKEIRPDCSIVFVTGYSEYKSIANDEKCSGYLMKPASEQDIEMALAYIKVKKKPKVTKRMRVQCFGSFEVFVDDQPLVFKRSKTKEVFAYLVDRRGALLSTAEICAVVWYETDDEKKAQSYCRNCISDLRTVLKENDLQDVLIEGWNKYGIDRETFWCDAYEFEKGNIDVINTYNKEYMSQYSWCEDRLADYEFDIDLD